MRASLILIVIFTAAASVWAQPGGRSGGDDSDLRVRYGTRSLEAARAIERGITLAQERTFAEALKAFEVAIRLDPECDFSHFWRANVLHDLGRVDESIKGYETAYRLGGKEKTLIEVEAALNLGLMLAKLGQHDEGERWMSRAVLADPRNRYGRLAKAMRNLSVTAVQQGRFLCAALRGAAARRLDPTTVSEELLEEMVQKVGAEEAAQLVVLEREVAPALPRARATELTPVGFDAGAIGRRIDLMLPGESGNYVLGFTFREKDYFVLRCDDPLRAERVSTSGVVLAASVQGGDLYLSLAGPARIVRCEPVTGREERVLLKDAEVAASIAVLPRQGRLYYTDGKRLYELNLASGVRQPLDKSATFVASDPEESILFTVFLNRVPGEFVDLIVDGRPLMMHIAGDDGYDPLAQFVVEGSSLVLTGVRINAGWNSSRLLVSSGGEYVAVVAGGGWRPRGGGGGYGVPLFDSRDLGRVCGYFNTDAYPKGVAINPVTRQVAAVTEKHALVYDVAKADASVELVGEYTGACAWSGDGSKLLLATKDGVQVQANALTDQEIRLARAPRRARPPEAAKGAEKRAGEKRAAARPILPENFVPRERMAEVRASLLAALEGGSDKKPAAWRSGEDGAWRDAPGIIDGLPADAGVRMYRLRQALEEHKGSAPLQLELAAALADSDQREEAESLLLAVLRSDRGRTDLSVDAATRLGALLKGQGRGVAALDCAAAALKIDRANPAARELAREVAAALGQEDLVRKIDGPSGGAVGARADSRLPAPTGDEPVLAASKVYAACADAVVGVESGGASGAGFVITGNGRVLTCAHVVPSGRRDATVVVYGRDARSEKAPRRYSAAVELRDEANDVLVLKVVGGIDQIKPLTLVEEGTEVGTRVFALGHPRLGDRALEQSLTDGIVSANGRIIDGKSYVQHTAAIAPGSSGGPLVDERGLVVGLVSLKADLRETGFAVPARRVREALKQLKP